MECRLQTLAISQFYVCSKYTVFYCLIELELRIFVENITIGSLLKHAPVEYQNFHAVTDVQPCHLILFYYSYQSSTSKHKYCTCEVEVKGWNQLWQEVVDRHQISPEVWHLAATLCLVPFLPRRRLVMGTQAVPEAITVSFDLSTFQSKFQSFCQSASIMQK